MGTIVSAQTTHVREV